MAGRCFPYFITQMCHTNKSFWSQPEAAKQKMPNWRVGFCTWTSGVPMKCSTLFGFVWIRQTNAGLSNTLTGWFSQPAPSEGKSFAWIRIPPHTPWTEGSWSLLEVWWSVLQSDWLWSDWNIQQEEENHRMNHSHNLSSWLPRNFLGNNFFFLPGSFPVPGNYFKRKRNTLSVSDQMGIFNHNAILKTQTFYITLLAPGSNGLTVAYLCECSALLRVSHGHCWNKKEGILLYH